MGRVETKTGEGRLWPGGALRLLALEILIYFAMPF